MVPLVHLDGHVPHHLESIMCTFYALLCDGPTTVGNRTIHVHLCVFFHLNFYLA